MKKRIGSALLILIGAIIGFAIGIFLVGKIENEKNNKTKGMLDKYLTLFLMMNNWVNVKQEGKNLVSYFEKKGYHRIAIYGMSYAGETLRNELKNSDIIVEYGIDNNAAGIYSELDIVSSDDRLIPVDAIVVTAITFFDEIEDKLSKKVKCPIISLEDILNEI